jgi:hypothetical protein
MRTFGCLVFLLRLYYCKNAVVGTVCPCGEYLLAIFRNQQLGRKWWDCHHARLTAIEAPPGPGALEPLYLQFSHPSGWDHVLNPTDLSVLLFTAGSEACLGTKVLEFFISEGTQDGISQCSGMCPWIECSRNTQLIATLYVGIECAFKTLKINSVQIAKSHIQK